MLFLYYMITTIRNFVFILFLFNAPLSYLSQNTEYTCNEIVTKSLKSIKEIKSLKYHLKITERGKKGFNYYESNVKFNRNPRLIYLYIKGIELLWLQGKNNGKALVKPNSFPFFNLNLDPMGNLMRQDQHHTLNEMGYDYFASVIEYNKNKLGDKFDDFFKLAGEEKINNRNCYKITIDNRDFGYVNYTIGNNESITSIARKFYISEYMILEKNPKFNDYFDLLNKGDVIKIPTWYCKTVVMYIDKQYFVPVGLKIFDDKGLFEEYNYHYLQVNPKFEDAEFTRDYKDYDF